MAVGFGWGATKPPPGVTLNRSHPLALGLIFSLSLREGNGAFIDDIAGTVNPVSNGMTWRSSAWGPGLNTVQASSQFSTFDNSRLWSLNVPLTCAWGFVPTTTGINQAVWQTDTNGTTHTGVQALLLSGNGLEVTIGDNTNNTISARRTGTSGASAAAAGIPFTCVQVIRGLTDMSTYCNGAPLSMTYTGSGAGLVNALSVGNLGRRLGGSTIYANGTLLSLMIWNRALSDGEARELSIAPYQMFAPPVWRRYFVPAAAPAGGARYLLERPEGLVNGGLVH